uniref:AAA+ ATPase At3g28540-like C-terminal domain-containing protein n=1 Tax=Oryza punctata TaxID=4537 RepID=A0A0E0JKG4_ORYPU
MFDTLAIDPELKRSIVANIGRFLKRKEYYRRAHRQGVEARLQVEGRRWQGAQDADDDEGNWRDDLSDKGLLRLGRLPSRRSPTNYFVIGDHPMFPEIQRLLTGVEATPAEVSEMLLRSEDADAALRALVEFLEEKKRAMCGSK